MGTFFVAAAAASGPAVRRPPSDVSIINERNERLVGRYIVAWLCERAPLWVVVHVSALLRAC